MNSVDCNTTFTLERALAEPEYEEPVDGEEEEEGLSDTGLDVNLNRPLRVKSRSSYAQLEVQSMGIDLTKDPTLETQQLLRPDRENNLEVETTEDPLPGVLRKNRSNLGSRGVNNGFLDYYRMLETAVRQRQTNEGSPDRNTGRLSKADWNHSSEKEVDESEGAAQPLLSPSPPGEDPLVPEGWERHLDDDGPYYWHIRTGTIQREPPVSPTAEGPHPPARLRRASEELDLEPAFPYVPPTEEERLAKRQSYPQGRQGGQCPAADGASRGSPLRFAVRSLGWAEIPEEELTPERSSRAVNRCIVDLSLGRGLRGQGTKGQGAGAAILDGVGRWGEGRDLLLELDEARLRLLRPQDGAPLHVQPLHAIRVWGVGRDNGRERDFAYVARDRSTRRFMCHVFRCDMPARIIANALRDVCKKMMVERSLSVEEPRGGNRPTSQRNMPSKRSGSAMDRLAGLSLEGEEGPVFPCPMEEPRKVLRALYLGSVPVAGPSGMDLLNNAIDALLDQVPRSRWLPVQVAVAPSTVTVLLDAPTRKDSGDQREVLAECRVRFLSFLGIGKQVTNCGFVMHTAQDGFVAHIFHCEPSSGALCKTIEAACKLRYQKCLDAHRQGASGRKNLELQQSQQTKGLSTTLKSVIGNISTRIVGRKGLSAMQQQEQAEAS